MKAARALGRWLRTHKRGEEDAVLVGAGWLATRLAVAAGLGAGVAAAATLAPNWIDESNNNGARAAVAIAAPTVEVVDAKATEGVRFQDPDYPVFRAAARTHHKAFGGYLFLHPDLGGGAQADYFLAYARPQPGDIQPVVDSELGSPSAAAPATYAALRELVRHGYAPILYASSSYLARLVRADPRIKAFRVWQAEYGPTLHLVPGVHVVAWQFTYTAHVNGIPVDGTHLLVRDIRSLEWRPKPLTPAQQKQAARAAAEAKLHARTGYFAWLGWELHEGVWRPYAVHAAAVRPHVPAKIPAAWWRRERAFIAARTHPTKGASK